MPVITVSQLNNYMKRYIEQNSHLSDLWVKAEISNFKKHYSGHIYMTLKDEASSIKAVMFKSYADKLGFPLKDGTKVIACGKLSVYERDGIYQLYVESLIPDGVGELYAAYEKLKIQLAEEGLFDQSKKKMLPQFPKCIGVITSVSGAALRDIMNVIKRRYNLCDICIYPVKVQGIGASSSVCEALDFFSNDDKCDVVILARGGGSIEDLWTFNEEATARAIYRCKKPVISGVGHETDFTISDFVADLRAPTPSAAAELATPDQAELVKRISEYKKYVETLILSYINNVSDYLKTIDKTILINKMNLYFENKNLHYETLNIKMLNSFTNLNSTTMKKLTMLSASLNAMNPKKVLERGYSILADADGIPIDTFDIKVGDKVKVVFNNGHIRCNVMEVKYDK